MKRFPYFTSHTCNYRVIYLRNTPRDKIVFLAKNVKHNEQVSENVFVTSSEVKSEAGHA